MSNTAYATLSDVISISGATYTAEQQARIETLLPLISDGLRVKAQQVNRDLDEMIAADTSGAYANVVKTVTCDIVARAMRQSTDGDPMSQESQSALGYTWSGTYAIPGGGVEQAIMRNDLKALGLKRQRIGVIELWEKSRDYR